MAALPHDMLTQMTIAINQGERNKTAQREGLEFAAPQSPFRDHLTPTKHRSCKQEFRPGECGVLGTVPLIAQFLEERLNCLDLLNKFFRL